MDLGSIYKRLEIVKVYNGGKKMGKEIEWEYIEQDIWKPTNDNNTIIGTLIGKAQKEENIGARYYIENETGKYVVWGSAILDNKMQFVDVGQVVKICYEGKSRNRQGQEINNFMVAVPKAVASGSDDRTTEIDVAQ